MAAPAVILTAEMAAELRECIRADYFARTHPAVTDAPAETAPPVGN
jgi:hypothetical protein